jgi:YbgC/YbaW family acyl-CoA thioester hydrolase
METFEMRGRIRWADADAAGRLHFPKMFEYFEDAETELLRRAGYSMHGQPGGYDFPRVHVECQFRKMLALDAPFVLSVTVGKIGRTSIRYDYRVFTDAEPRELALEGSMTVVVVRGGKPAEIPADLRAALEPYAAGAA